jgi:hypothetical protein
VIHAPRAHGCIADGVLRNAGTHDDERHVHGGLIQQASVLRFAVLAECFTVIADDDNRVRRAYGFVERTAQTGHLAVHEVDLPDIALPRRLAGTSVRRSVRRVGIVVVDPEETGLR